MNNIQAPSSIHNIFPEPIGEYKLNRDLSKSEHDAFKDQAFRENVANHTSIDMFVLKKKNLGNVREFLEVCLNDYASKVYDFKNGSANLYITSSWVNMTKPGECHHKHSHPNLIVSGTFYISGNDTDSIEFHHPKKSIDGSAWFFPANEFNEYTSGGWHMPTLAGTLYLWNSNLSHSVPEVIGGDPRYSLAFNTFVRGQIGLENEATGLLI